MSLLIINPIDELQSVLAGKTDAEKSQYLEMTFTAKVDKSIEESGYWIVIQNGKIAFLSLKTNSFLKMPHEASKSEYFGEITSIMGLKSPSSDDTLIVFSIGGVYGKNEELIKVDSFCTIKDGKIDVADNIPHGSSFQTGVNIIITQEATRNIRTTSQEEGGKAGSNEQNAGFNALVGEFPGGKRTLH